MKNHHTAILVCALINSFVICNGQQTLVDAMHHVRNGQPREWSEFPIDAQKKEFSIHFSSHVNKSAQTISIRQYDVKLDWRIILNGQDIGSLATDEKDMIIYLAVPGGVLHDGQNELLIKCDEPIPDDIRVGEIKIDPRPLSEVLSDGSVEIQIFDNNSGKLLPSRITIINADGVLQSVSSSPDMQIVLRPGVVYTATGKALLKFPSGTYKIYVGREYGCRC